MPALQLFDGAEEGLMRCRHFGPELGTDALGQPGGTETRYHLSDILLPPASVQLGVLQGGALGGREGGGGEEGEGEKGGGREGGRGGGREGKKEQKVKSVVHFCM